MTVALLATGAQIRTAYLAAQADPTPTPGLRMAGVEVGGLEGAALALAVDDAGQRALDRDIVLTADGHRVDTSPRALGAVAATDSAIEAALAVGREGDVLSNLRQRGAAARGQLDLKVGYRFVEGPALEQLVAMAPDLERHSTPTRLDLERRRIEPAHTGVSLLAYDSLSSVAIGLARGADEIDLVVRDKAPVSDDPLREIAEGLDVATVVGSFSTGYREDETQRDRSHNLKVGAARIDGTVLMPGETFSFNETVGPRSAEAGFRYAPGITAGELVDVLGGGICQVSSTLYGAAFFAGLELVSARPHSRPSSYVDMGLDSTVVYPTIDMKMKNPFDFPVVLHMSVSQGKVRAEVLGARRPYQVAFERQLEEAVDFPTVWRDDARLRTGATVVAQRGMRGFRVRRLRKLYQGGQVVDEQSWELHYPSTTQIVRRGTNPSGEVPESKDHTALRDPASTLRIVQ
jgi:vancomycin resistance protein YoaR